MANPLAPHVSRTVKEYAPHGFSVMETSAVVYTLIAGGTDAQFIPLVFADQSDIYLEAGSFISCQEIPSHGTNYWTFTLITGPNGLASDVSLSDNVGGASTALADATNHPFTITTANAVIPKGQCVWLKMTPNHASSPAKVVAARIRFRVKA